MFTRVLLPLDGSARAEQAIPTAVQLVRACGGTLILAHIRNMNVPYSLASAPEMTQELIEQDKRAGKAYLTYTAHLPERGEIAIEQVVMYGPVASSLLSLIASQPADQVVLTSHGRTGFTRWALGSITERVLLSTKLPILIVRPPQTMVQHEHQQQREAVLG